MTKTYSEQRQQALFRAARELRYVACQVLDDTGLNEVELKSAATLSWAISLASSIAIQANELEEKAHELSVATSRQNTALYKSRQAYSESVTAFQKRIDSTTGRDFRTSVERRAFGS